MTRNPWLLGYLLVTVPASLLVIRAFIRDIIHHRARMRALRDKDGAR